MYSLINLITTPLRHNRSTNRSSFRRWALIIAVALAWFALSPAPNAFAVSPPPDGGYPNFNTAEGDNALFNLTSGNNNTALGSNALLSNTTGSGNTATGSGALANNLSGSSSTALGFQALLNNTLGSFNTAIGLNALFSNTGSDGTDASHNTAIGVNALFSNTYSSFNTAIGESALYSNTIGGDNTAIGVQALYNNAIGGGNTAIGEGTLHNNTTGGDNAATGRDALFSNTTGNSNAATGFEALPSNTTGNANTASGCVALFGNTTGSNNIALGFLAGANLTTGSNNIDIGANVFGVTGEANTIRIGKQGTQKKTFVAGIRGVAVASGVGVIVGSTGQLGTVVSSARFKDDIKPMDKMSEALLKLKPVTFRYKQELDPDKIPQFGLIAEEVEKIDPELVVRDENGNVTTVRYEAVNAMLLNEFLKAHCKVEEQAKINQQQEATIVQLKSAAAQEKELQATVARQQEQIERLTRALKEEAAQIQKVSDRLALSPPAPRVVINNP